MVDKVINTGQEESRFEIDGIDAKKGNQNQFIDGQVSIAVDTWSVHSE
jgi:hypothetical protein